MWLHTAISSLVATGSWPRGETRGSGRSRATRGASLGRRMRGAQGAFLFGAEAFDGGFGAGGVPSFERQVTIAGGGKLAMLEYPALMLFGYFAPMASEELCSTSSGSLTRKKLL